MNADKSEMIRCAEPSGKPVYQLESADGWGQIQRAYIDMTRNGLPLSGVIRAAAMVPIPLTAISTGTVTLVGPTCLNQSIWTRSDNFTTIGHRSYNRSDSGLYQFEFHT